MHPKLHSKPKRPFARLIAGTCALGLLLLLPIAIRGGGQAAVSGKLAAAVTGLQVQGNQLLDGTGKPIQLRGVNYSGTEYACIKAGGWAIFDGPSDAAAVQTIASWHANIVRVLLNEDCWLGINVPNAAFAGANYQNAIKNYVALLNQNGIYAEVALIWGAPGNIPATDQPPAPDADHSPAMWSSMAAAFAGNPNVILSPWGETTVGWGCFRDGGCQASFGGVAYTVAGMQQAVTLMRQAGYNGPISTSCINYANNCSDANGNWLQYQPNDPKHALLAEQHVYGKNGCMTVTCFDQTFAPVAQVVPMIWGETGETYDASDCSAANMQVFMPWADAHNVSYAAWTWNTWNNCSALVGDWAGTPFSAYASWVKKHYADLASSPPAATVPGAPTAVTAAAANNSVNVSWTAPSSTGGSAITSYAITAYDGCTIQGSKTVSAPASAVLFDGLTNGTAYAFRVSAINGVGTSTQSTASNVVVPFGATTPPWLTACSTQQYRLTNSNGSSWSDLDPANLSLSFQGAANSWALITANVDLWTADAGYNQDIGVMVNGSVAAWKESGGFAGTFSPNAATVQTAIPLAASTSYTTKLVWKASKADPGSIHAGAGPIAGSYSPTRLTVQIVSATRVFNASSTLQYQLTASDGRTWKDIDPGALSVAFAPPTGTWMAYVFANADLWTSSSGYNQDLGLNVNGSLVAWKESGGSAGTLSPNAAFVQTTIGPTLRGSYTAKLQWKANQADPGTIWAGAGPIGGRYSPTSLTVLLAAPTSAIATGNAQYSLANSDGSTWKPIDSNVLRWTLSPGANMSYMISACADLWTSYAGYNQDLGIMVSGGAYTAGTLVAWKESGGFAGTFSPNAALVTTDLHLQAGNTYTVWLVWKANRNASSGGAIWAGAGPISTQFSPTALTAQALG